MLYTFTQRVKFVKANHIHFSKDMRELELTLQVGIQKGAIILKDSSVFLPSCLVDSPRQIRPDSSLEWASDGVQGG